MRRLGNSTGIHTTLAFETGKWGPGFLVLRPAAALTRTCSNLKSGRQRAVGPRHQHRHAAGSAPVPAPNAQPPPLLTCPARAGRRVLPLPGQADRRAGSAAGQVLRSRRSRGCRQRRGATRARPPGAGGLGQGGAGAPCVTGRLVAVRPLGSTSAATPGPPIRPVARHRAGCAALARGARGLHSFGSVA